MSARVLRELNEIVPLLRLIVHVTIIFSDRNVLRGRGMGAESLVDTEQALFRGVRSVEIDIAGRNARGQGARAGHRRNRAERRVPAVENVRGILGRPDSGSGRESEQLVYKNALVRSTAVAGFGSGLQYRRHADASATAARRKIRKLVGKRDQARAGAHTGDQFGRSRRDKCSDQRAAEYCVQDRMYVEHTAERSHDKRHVLSRRQSYKRTFPPPWLLLLTPVSASEIDRLILRIVCF